MSDDTPESIDEALRRFEEIKADKEPFRKALQEDLDTFLAKTHQAGGRYVRNNWGLWQGHMALTDAEDPTTGEVPSCPPLAKEINERTGLTHADDMSGFLFRRAYEHLNGTTVNLYKWLRRIRNHWIGNDDWETSEGREDDQKSEEFAPLKREIHAYVREYRRHPNSEAEEGK